MKIKQRILIYSLLLLFSQAMLDAASIQKKQMKILMVVPSFPKISDVCMLNQITGLIRRGHDVYIYTKRRGDFSKIHGDVETYDLINRTFYELYPSDLDTYDIVVFQLGHKAFNIKETHGYQGKMVICLRGQDISEYIQKNPHAYDELIEVCDLFMPVCQLFKERIKNLGCSSDKVIVHHSAIDCSRFVYKERELPKEGPIKIISAGRFIEKKGIEYGIRAIANLVKKYPRIHYTIIGGGPLEECYRNLISQLAVEENVEIKSWLNHEELVDVLNSSHIFLSPSVTAKDYNQEGIPNVLKEAMAMGLLAVSTYHAGIPELITDGISGFLAPERDYCKLSQIIEMLLKNPKIWKHIGEAARKKVEQEFDTEKENDKLEHIFLTLISEE